tara:strand:- start:437 stop:1330 length:894 start_codon:yes stop_codon:yes gene_type:complete
MSKLFKFLKIFDRRFFFILKKIKEMYLYFLRQKNNIGTNKYTFYSKLINPNYDLNYKLFLRSNEKMIYSNDGSDGFINFVFSEIEPKSFRAIEIGAGGDTSNILNLNLNYGWECNYVDGSTSQLNLLKESWGINDTNLSKFHKKFLTPDNFQSFLYNFKEVDFLSIDIDGNDIYFLEKIDEIRPRLIEIEYNSLLGLKDIKSKYSEEFNKYKFHQKVQFSGASLKSIEITAKKVDYELIYCTKLGVNAFLIDKNINKGKIKSLSSEMLFEQNKSLEEKIFKHKINKDVIIQKVMDEK